MSAESYRVRYISPEVVRANGDFLIYYYEDADTDATCLRISGAIGYGGRPDWISFPPGEQWDRTFPRWAGRREIVRGRIIDYAKRFIHLQFLVKLLSE